MRFDVILGGSNQEILVGIILAGLLKKCIQNVFCLTNRSIRINGVCHFSGSNQEIIISTYCYDKEIYIIRQDICSVLTNNVIIDQPL